MPTLPLLNLHPVQPTFQLFLLLIVLSLHHSDCLLFFRYNCHNTNPQIFWVFSGRKWSGGLMKGNNLHFLFDHFSEIVIIPLGICRNLPISAIPVFPINPIVAHYIFYSEVWAATPRAFTSCHVSSRSTLHRLAGTSGVPLLSRRA